MSNWCPENDGAYRAEMAEVAKITMEANLSRALIAEKRIRELKAEVERLERDNARQLANLLRIRTEATEAEVERLRVENAQLMRSMAQEQVRAEAAEAKLAAVAGLPERYRNMGDADEHAAYWTAAYLCADELEARLREEGK